MDKPPNSSTLSLASQPVTQPPLAPSQPQTMMSGLPTRLSRQSFAYPLVALALALCMVPWLFGEFVAYQVSLYLLYGIAAQGIALVWGRCGFLPLGQALFFGLGAYLAAGALKASEATETAQAAWWLWPSLLASILLPALLAWGLARLLFHRRHDSGPFFSLITLALAMLGFQWANQWTNLTGGFNGLSGIPDLPSTDRYSTLYPVIGVSLMSTTALLLWLDQSPIGTLWRAVADNENRLQFFGYATDRIKALAFGLSAALAALGGVLYAAHQGLVTPQVVGVQLSAELLIWTAVGGRGHPLGALLGTVGIGLLSSELKQHFAYWEVFIASLFLLVVLRFPGGLLGSLQGFAAWLRGTGSTASPGRSARSADTTNTVSPVPAPPLCYARDSQQPTLQLRTVHVRQSGVHILRGLDLHIAERGIHGLIGPNGAGKTSCFQTLTGRLPLSEGGIEWAGLNLVGQTAYAVARCGVGRKFQIPSVFTSLSVAENLQIALWANRARLSDLLTLRAWRWQSDWSQQLLASCQWLTAMNTTHAGHLSQGQRQTLELVMTMLPEPRLLLLDEPCAGLSPQETVQQLRLIADATQALGCTSLLIEHDMTAIESLAHRVHVLHQGQLLASGTLAEIQSNDAVHRVYAGGKK